VKTLGIILCGAATLYLPEGAVNDTDLPLHASQNPYNLSNPQHSPAAVDRPEFGNCVGLFSGFDVLKKVGQEVGARFFVGAADG